MTPLKIVPAMFAVAVVAALVIASPVASQAKAKKTAEAAAPTNPICFLEYKPVCADKGGMKMTYASACYAGLDAAKVVKSGACKPAKKMAMKKK